MNRTRKAWLLAVLAATTAAAMEPVGVVAIERRWLADLPAGLEQTLAADERVVQLDLSALRSIGAGVLTLEPPPEVTLRPLDPPTDGGAIDPGERRTISLGPLAARSRRALHIAVRDRDVRSGTVVVLVVEGRLESGEPFREAVGLTVGRAEGGPPVRGGAVEFPAQIEPGEPR